LVGYCLGGLISFLTVARKGADAAVAYYGGGTDKYVGEADKLADPLLMHLAEEDEFISKEAQQVILAALKGHPQIEIHTYPGCSHAFAQRR
jgi:carboxymethylenebutenolidase